MDHEIHTINFKIPLKDGMKFGMKYRIQDYEGWNGN